MAVNFSYFRQHATTHQWCNLAVFVVTNMQQRSQSPYRLLSEFATFLEHENMKVDYSLLVVSDGGKKSLYGDSRLIDLVSNVGVPRPTHTLAV